MKIQISQSGIRELKRIKELEKFTDQFSSRIKQSDNTLEDAEKIAKQFIAEIKSNPSAAIPEATGETLDYKQYLKMPDGSTYDPNNINHADASDLTVQVYNAEKEGDIRQMLEKEAKDLNDSRSRDLVSVVSYLEDNTDYSVIEQAMILDGARKFGYISRQTNEGIQVNLISLTAKNRTSIPVINGITASLIASHLRNGKSIKEAMLEGFKESVKKTSINDKTRNGWICFKQSDTEEAAVELNEACAGREWCTAGAVSTARSHRSGGDFWVYFENGEAKIAVRTENGTLAEPPRGSLPGQKLTEKEDEIATSFLKTNTVKGGEDHISDSNYIKGIMNGNVEDLDLFMRGLDPRRKSKNGHDEDGDKFSVALGEKARKLYEAKDWKSIGYYEELPDKKEWSKVIVLRSSIKGNEGDVSLPMVTTVGDIEYNKGNVSLPKATTVGDISSNEHDVSLPSATTVGDISINEHDVSLPMATTVGNIYNNRADVSLPSATTVGDIWQNEGSVSLPNETVFASDSREAHTITLKPEITLVPVVYDEWLGLEIQNTDENILKSLKTFNFEYYSNYAGIHIKDKAGLAALFKYIKDEGFVLSSYSLAAFKSLASSAFTNVKSTFNIETANITKSVSFFKASNTQSKGNTLKIYPLFSNSSLEFRVNLHTNPKFVPCVGKTIPNLNTKFKHEPGVALALVDSKKQQLDMIDHLNQSNLFRILNLEEAKSECNHLKTHKV